MSDVKRILIWLKRFRYRCGYGVHSPFAFDFITNVIYEKTPYYAYQEIEQEIKNSKIPKSKKDVEASRKINRLLFRLVNRMQPSIIIDAGRSANTALYLRSAKKMVRYVSVASVIDREILKKSENILLYINYPTNPQQVETIFESGIDWVGKEAMFIIQGINSSASMKILWKQMAADERVGITFDLYDIGILFFDKSKVKQHYIVNF